MRVGPVSCLVAAAALLAACGASPAASPTASNGTAGWLTYTSHEYPGWRFSYPPSWKLTDQSQGGVDDVRVTSPDGQVVVKWRPDPGTPRDVACGGGSQDQLSVALVPLPHAPGLAIAEASAGGAVYGESVVTLATGSTTDYLTVSAKGQASPAPVHTGPTGVCAADFYFVNPAGQWGAGFGTITAAAGPNPFGGTGTLPPTSATDAATLTTILESLHAPGH